MNRDDSVFNRINSLKYDVIDLKKKQLIGSDSVISYLNTSGNTWDFEWTSADDFGGGSYFKNVYVTFSADSQSAPFANLSLEATYNGIVYDPSTISNTFSNHITIDQSFIGNSVEELRNDDIFKWVVRVEAASAGTDIKIKFKVRATDTGTISVSYYMPSGV